MQQRCLLVLPKLYLTNLASFWFFFSSLLFLPSSLLLFLPSSFFCYLLPPLSPSFFLLSFFLPFFLSLSLLLSLSPLFLPSFFLSFPPSFLSLLFLSFLPFFLCFYFSYPQVFPNQPLLLPFSQLPDFLLLKCPGFVLGPLCCLHSFSK
jgi:hypothetical protein